MHDLLHLKGVISSMPAQGRPGPPELPKHGSVKREKVETLIQQLEHVLIETEHQQHISKKLVSVTYIRLLAKSNRIAALLEEDSKGPTSHIVGARYSDEPELKHIITYYISTKAIERTIERLHAVRKILETHFDGVISDTQLNTLPRINFETFQISKTKFRQIIKDVYYVESFTVPSWSWDSEIEGLISFYTISDNIQTVLHKIGVYVDPSKFLTPYTLHLRSDEISKIKHELPYLVAMAVRNIGKWDKPTLLESDVEVVTIPKPENEPVVGVIDMPFSDQVYFSEWVEYHPLVHPEIEITKANYDHGTGVSSIIVDGPAGNPWLEDGCGRFKVRHFGVAAGRSFNSFRVLKQIEEIVQSHIDIKVWNLSLGSVNPFPTNYISAEAAFLDELQVKYDCIFVIAGSNLPEGEVDNSYKMGAPADSMNAIVVNAVDEQGEPADYSRSGPVLRFYTKPDLAYFGGDQQKRIMVCTSTGAKNVQGTSFAAPWVTRKVAYLIYKMKMSKEIAKALLIDAASAWGHQRERAHLTGYGVLPKHIDTILTTANDEIRFFIQGKTSAEDYKNYNYNLPVPLKDGKHAYVARATLCYFPTCDRSQGVDYTQYELDFRFGRIDNKGEFKSIDDNRQVDPGIPTYELEARKEFKKWNNVKLMNETFSTRKRAKKAYNNPLWGFEIHAKDRTTKKDSRGTNYGIVITLKAIDGLDNYHAFIRNCQMRGWIVEQISIEQQMDIYNLAEEVIEWDE